MTTGDDRKGNVRREIAALIPHLRRFARYLVQNPEWADDLVQECLVRAVASLDRYEDGTNLKAWLFTILRNIYKNDLRKSANRRRVEEDLTHEASTHSKPGQESAVALQEVRHAFAHLSPEHREILLLTAVEGVGYEEAGEMLDIPIGTVRSRVSRARARLTQLLQEPGGADAMTAAAGDAEIDDLQKSD
ncbi:MULTISPECIES: sigma-70 family RNA polymerase sigma factor [Afifella]|uniref:sigma-70 family RNA polymerase sigma factor n=1 Tax=Afifella TaxID=643217 RepID=UPI00196A4105|nr:MULTISPECIES: sigma-70 family RNA polymerase sigma factor [Afifella]MCT8268514.1 sigma-70 family RNA polymerase sigma factor [Afifella sp. JA880]